MTSVVRCLFLRAIRRRDREGRKETETLRKITTEKLHSRGAPVSSPGETRPAPPTETPAARVPLTPKAQNPCARAAFFGRGLKTNRSANDARIG